MLSMALCLAKEHEVFLIWDKTSPEMIVKQARTRFQFDLSELTFVKSPFTPKVSLMRRLKVSKEYDLMVVLSDGSIPVVSCPLILHFQSPMMWINGRSLMNRLKLSRVRHIVVNSNFTKKYIDASLGRKTSVLYPPVAIQRSYDPQKKTKTILNVGRFGINQAGSSFKKQDVLADAFVKMNTLGLKGWQLTFVMSVSDKDKEAFELFKKKYSEYPIVIVSNPTNSELWDIYEKASMYWHASGFGEDLNLYPDRAEHFGISTVEAMGVGAVPIVVNAGGQKEIVEDGINGRLWGTLDELEEATKELINNPKRLQELAEQGILDSQKFSGDRFCRDIKKLIL